VKNGCTIVCVRFLGSRSALSSCSKQLGPVVVSLDETVSSQGSSQQHQTSYAAPDLYLFSYGSTILSDNPVLGGRDQGSTNLSTFPNRKRTNRGHPVSEPSRPPSASRRRSKARSLPAHHSDIRSTHFTWRRGKTQRRRTRPVVRSPVVRATRERPTSRARRPPNRSALRSTKIQCRSGMLHLGKLAPWVMHDIGKCRRVPDSIVSARIQKLTSWEWEMRCSPESDRMRGGASNSLK